MTHQYIKDYFDKLADDWGEKYSRSSLFKIRYQEFNKIINEYNCSNSVVLDYGCGSGALINLVIKNAKLIIGTDVSQKMMAVTRRRFSGFKNVKIINIKELKANYFDLVICSSVIEYVENYIEFFSDICGYLKPNGIIIITFPNRFGLLQMLNRHLISKITKNSYIRYQKNTYTKKDIRRLLSTANMRELKLYSCIGLPILSRFGMGELLFCVAEKTLISTGLNTQPIGV